MAFSLPGPILPAEPASYNWEDQSNFILSSILMAQKVIPILNSDHMGLAGETLLNFGFC